MKIDLSSLPVIDNHCHPIALSRETPSFEASFCIGLYPVPDEDMRNSLYFNQVINALRRFLKMPENATVDEIIAARNALARGPKRMEYCKALFEDANIKFFLSDIGYPISQKRCPEKKLTEAEMTEYAETAAYSGVEIRQIDRIEWICNRLLKEHLPFEVFEKRLYDEAVEMVRSEHLIAVKSVVAYYTGLDVRVLSEQGFKDGYYAYFANPRDWNAEKVVRDFTFVKACEVCRDLNIPLQIHTGLGDTPECHIVRVNPALLTDALNTPRCRDTKIVLIHGGYPYCEELGMLVNHYKNVYCDISSFIPFASIATYDKVRSLLELAPLNKVFFGTDGGGTTPESMWFGAINFKKVFARILEELIEEGYITYDFAMQSAENILYNNVRRVYGF